MFQRYAIDDDNHSSIMVTGKESKQKPPVGRDVNNKFDDTNNTADVDHSVKAAKITTVYQKEKIDINNNSNAEVPLFDVGKRLPCNWTTGAGPRIGCVRDYPADLQSRALEQVNLSPRPPTAPFVKYGPIPSPRPSPKVRLSPRISYMGLPSPRTPIAAAS